MKPEKLVQHLADAVRKTGYRVRTEEGNFRGGSCVFAEERLVILNRRMSQEERADVLGRVLATESLDTIFLLPEVRAFIEKFLPPQEPVASDEEVKADTEPAESPPDAPSDAPAAPPETDRGDAAP
ncbi:MAG TPA: hypothetical protein VGL38_11010 [bacterium]|jgi:hypothetical protein